MSEFDRLSSLIRHFSLKVMPTHTGAANLMIFEHIVTGKPCRALLSPMRPLPMNDNSRIEQPIFSALTEWGGCENPLFATLPDQIDIEIEAHSDMALLAQLLKSENTAQRCGVSGVLNRLGEVLMIHILRRQIERGATAPGLLGGLADQRLSRAIVSMHEAPGRHWRNDDLAAIAGLSLSRFAELFQQRVGQTPQGYLRLWRMILARRDIEHGERIQTVARRYGYGSSEALSRAFQRQFGKNPIHCRKQLNA